MYHSQKSAIHFVNSQLSSLFENAVERIACDSRANLKPLDRVRDDWALREFHIGSPNQSTVFSATFNKPYIDFACSHEAVLYLIIKEGHFNSHWANVDVGSHNIPIRDMKLAFRMDFKLQTIVANVIANKSRSIQALALDVATATLATDVANRKTLEHYLKQYLGFLYEAGQIALFFLPEFEDDGSTTEVAFSPRPQFIRNMAYGIVEILGVDLGTINRGLSSKWLKSIVEVDAEYTERCLSEIQSTWSTLGNSEGVQFWAKFAPPVLKILCKHEAIVTFFIEDLVVFYGDKSKARLKRTFRNWKIVTLVDVVEKTDGSITQIKLDLKTFHVFEPLCAFSDLDLSFTWAGPLKSKIIKFFESDYAKLLETVSTDILYHHDERPQRIQSLKGTVLDEYDVIHVISAESVLEHFRTLLDNHSQFLDQWSYFENFTASFGAITLKFSSQDKAVIWIHLNNGSLKSSENDQRCEFSNWSLAFEVPIVLHEHEVASRSPRWLERFRESTAWKLHGNQSSRSFHHLCLDFSTARFIYDRSSFSGLPIDSDAPGYLHSAIHHISTHYFQKLIDSGYHIIHSLPVWKTGFNPPSFGCTSLSFQTYSQYVHNTETIHNSNAAVLLLGMTAFREHPKGRLPYDGEWFAEGRDRTVRLSRRIFMYKCLMNKLAHVNGATTVLPNFCPHATGAVIYGRAQENREGWRLALAAMVDVKGSVVDFDWSPNQNRLESDFVWEYSDSWDYEHTSLRWPGLRSRTVSCVTRNLLSFSTVPNDTLDINLKGHVVLTFKVNRDGSARLESTWSTTLSMKSLPGGGGLSFEIAGDHRPQFRTISTDVSIQSLFDVQSLQNLLRINLLPLAFQLCQSFGGVWQHCFANTGCGSGALTPSNPTFNKNWDIIFDLKPYVPAGKAANVVTIRTPDDAEYNESLALGKNLPRDSNELHYPLDTVVEEAGVDYGEFSRPSSPNLEFQNVPRAVESFAISAYPPTPTINGFDRLPTPRPPSSQEDVRSERSYVASKIYEGSENLPVEFPH